MVLYRGRAKRTNYSQKDTRFTIGMNTTVLHICKTLLRSTRLQENIVKLSNNIPNVIIIFFYLEFLCKKSEPVVLERFLFDRVVCEGV